MKRSHIRLQEDEREREGRRKRPSKKEEDRNLFNHHHDILINTNIKRGERERQTGTQMDSQMCRQIDSDREREIKTAILNPSFMI